MKCSTPIILASASPVRLSLLRNAGVDVMARASTLDERAAEKPLLQSGAPVADVATVLARLKALDVAKRYPQDVVIGADQCLEFEGRTLNKVKTEDEARARLLALRGKTHTLISAVACVRQDQILWQTSAQAHLTMRDFSPQFVGAYLAANRSAALNTVGCYALEGEGVQLFSQVEGDYFTILGLPLLPLLDYLRRSGFLMI